MSNIQAIYFDLGGVIVRTEDKAPRDALGKSLGLDFDGIDRLVFATKSAKQASIGAISDEQHWQNVADSLGLPKSEIERVIKAFFAGDRIDLTLIEFLRSLRPRYKTGLISNAFSGLRQWMIDQKIADAFDDITFSAEVGAAKPDPLIYQQALEKLGVRPEEAVFVDDVSHNVEAAKVLGMHGVIFQNAEQAIAKVKNLLIS